MSLINWDDSFSVNIVEIDNQHKKIVELINNMADAMKIGKGKVVLGGILNELVDYTVYHFKTEEDYFEQFGYSKIETQKKEHAEFKEKVFDLKKELKVGNQFFSIEVMTFLSSWLETHIKGVDKEYTAFFNAKGIK
jgi:hemerythrin